MGTMRPFRICSLLLLASTLYVLAGETSPIVHVRILDPTPNQQLDFHCGFGLSAAAPDHSVGFGYSVLCPLKVRVSSPDSAKGAAARR
jgi:hypothetical protein